MKTVIIADVGAFHSRKPPAEGARAVFFGAGRNSECGGPYKHVGWLMPQVSEVDPKTARAQARAAWLANKRSW